MEEESGTRSAAFELREIVHGGSSCQALSPQDTVLSKSAQNLQALKTSNAGLLTTSIWKTYKSFVQYLQTFGERLTLALVSCTKNATKAATQCSRWRMSVGICTAISFTIFCFNGILTIWAIRANTLSGSNAILYQGSCNRVVRMASWIQPLFNQLSNLTLGISSYCMQTLTAPSRQEVNRAHKRGHWLDLGMPSYRNLRFISSSKRLNWLLIGISAVPMHLL